MSVRTAPPDARRRDLATIHIAKTQLGLDDGTYRDMLFTLARVRSAADLDFAGRRRVLEHLRSRGFRSKPPARAKGRGARNPKQRKILALWLTLRDLGALDAGDTDAALDAFCHRQVGVDKFEWLDSAGCDLVITALKYWVERAKRKASGA